jgi:hypothetical protein
MTRAPGFLAQLALLACVAGGCAHRYSEDRRDWVGPQRRDFEADFAVCRKRMDDAPFRYGGDPRLLFLDCMKRLGWVLKGHD